MKFFRILGALALITALESAAQSQVHLDTPIFQQATVDLNWTGGHGPFLLETSSDLFGWTDHGERQTARSVTRPEYRSLGLYRVRDLDAGETRGPWIGVVETAQGEFGDLMARHRLKGRWWFHKPKGAISRVPATFFRSLIFDHQYQEDGKVRTFTGSFDTLPDAAITASGNQLRIAWKRGTDAGRRSYTLTLDFPYPVMTSRATEPRLNDPGWTLECLYVTPQLTFDGGERTSTTTKDSTTLVQLTSPAQFPVRSRAFPINAGGVRLSFAFTEGAYLDQGSPPWILKTLLLNEWSAPSVATSNLATFTTESFFSRTFLPGHHNFFHTFLIEPALDPALAETVRASLATANIRFIYAVHISDALVSGSPDSIAFIGYDGRVRIPR